MPRIEALRRVEEELHELLPELMLRVAHGKLAPEALDEAVTGFTRGEGDVPLATNIIEAGLDIPRANLILVREAERFGLAQLHQSRGWVGRGMRRGAAYFMPAPGRRLALRRRLARLHNLALLDEFGSELADHFGGIPPEAASLLAHARLPAASGRARHQHYRHRPESSSVNFPEGR